jgi:hypothetical protein
VKDQARLSLVVCSMVLLDTTRPTRRLCSQCASMVGYQGRVRWQHTNPKTRLRDGQYESAARVRYDRYKRSNTFEDAIAAGMTTQDRCNDVHLGYVKKVRQLFDCELDSTVRGASVPVIDLSQGEGASSDRGSSPHEATARSELLVSSDGSSYAAPSDGLVPDTRIACVSDNATAFSSDGSCYASPCANDRTVAGRGRLDRRRLILRQSPDTRIACVSDNAIAFSPDGGSYAAPSAGLVPDPRTACVSDNAIACATRQCAHDRTVAGQGRLVRRRLILRQSPDTRIACVSDSAIAFSPDGGSYAAPSAGLVPDPRTACVSDNDIACARCQRARDRNGRFSRHTIGPARINKKYTESIRVEKAFQRRLKNKASTQYERDGLSMYMPRVLCRYKGPVMWQQLNERVVGTASHARYERYKSSRYFGDAFAAGMRSHDRWDDVRRGYVKAVDIELTPLALR